MTIRVKSGRYTVVALIQVPDGYPMEGCGVEFKSHNFPAHIARRHLVQVMIVSTVVCWMLVVALISLIVRGG